MNLVFFIQSRILDWERQMIAVEQIIKLLNSKIAIKIEENHYWKNNAYRYNIPASIEG